MKVKVTERDNNHEKIEEYEVEVDEDKFEFFVSEETRLVEVEVVSA